MRDHKIKKANHGIVTPCIKYTDRFFLNNHSAIAIYTIEMGCTLYESRFEEQPEA